MAVTAQLPTLYEYYSSGGINTGLSTNQPYFTLNDRNITIYSGAMHYFRVPKPYWRDRLRKMRAAGLNAVETYVPWNLHEPEYGHYDFGKGGSDMEEFLDVVEFLETAKEEDLLAIVRPGPYICSEWEFGGLPSWLLRDPEIKVRTSQSSFIKYVSQYFNVLLPILAALQFTRGGPIIGFQVENEYGSTSQRGKFTPDKTYLEKLRDLYINNGIVELLFTSDSPTMHGSEGTLPGVLFQTANFASNPESEFNRLKELQSNKPSMAMEYWTGWFDHWTEIHHKRNDNDFYDILERILKYPASVNMYMFHGGTNWGFMNGANIAGSATDNSGYQPDTTSYDYDAPLTEAGDYTEKYVMVKELIKKYNSIETRIPECPSITLRRKYSNITVQQQLFFNEILNQIPEKIMSSMLMPMEFLPINNQSGQSYGYIIYRKSNLNISPNATLKVKGRVCDSVMVLLDGKLISKPLTQQADLDRFGYWRWKDSTLKLSSVGSSNATLELIVENWGRNNFGHLDQFKQHKGLWQGEIYVDNEPVRDFEIIPLQFKKNWTNTISGWHDVQNIHQLGPALYKTILTADQPQDTYINMGEWNKGIVIINGFVLGRYASKIGPQQTLYLPAPLLKQGHNEIIIFEHFSAANNITFSENPIFYTPTLENHNNVILHNQVRRKV